MANNKQNCRKGFEQELGDDECPYTTKRSQHIWKTHEIRGNFAIFKCVNCGTEFQGELTKDD